MVKNTAEFAQFEEKTRQEIKDKIDKEIKDKDKDKIDKEIKGNDNFYPIVKVGATARF